MEAKFLTQVDEVVRLVRKRNLAALGKHELAKLKLVQKRLGGRTGITEVEIGRALYDLIMEIIERMKPLTPENLDEPAWQHYILLKDHIILGHPWGIVAGRLCLGRSIFYERRKAALEFLASTLRNLEEEALHVPLRVQDNLPRPFYQYYVRRFDEKGQDYVERIISELAKRAWVVAIYGAAGVGKTTLAYAVAQQCRSSEIFDAIIWTSAKQEVLRPPKGRVSLFQYLTALNPILDTIGTTLGRRKVLSLSSAEKLALVQDLLLTTNCLIIIDNLETLGKEAHEEIFAFLRDIPGPSKVIVTSRERHYIGETIVNLPGMSKEEAFRFMRIEAETREVPSLNEEEMQYIYRVTGGVPLAMQYAIGLMAVYGYSAEEAIEPGVSQDVLLDFMFESTYDKLTDREKKILHVMPIFAKPASIEAIGATSSAREAQLTVGLGRLYHLFLVNKIGPDRYEILPLTRSFLQSILRRDGLSIEGKLVVDFLTDAYRNLAQYYIGCLQDMSMDKKLAFLKHEKRNILALMEWCYEDEEWQLVIDLESIMGHPLGTLRYLTELIEWGKRAMKACEALNQPEQKEWFAVYDVGWSYVHTGQREKGKEIFEESLQIAQEKGYRQVEALALRNLGLLAMDEGDCGKALELLEESLSIWEKLGDQEWLARTMNAVGRLKFRLDKLDEAQTYLEEALQLRKNIGDISGLIEVLSDLALVLLARGETERALVFSDESIYKAATIEKPARPYAYALWRRAEMEKGLNNIAEAARLAKEARQTYEDLGVKHMAAKMEGFLEALKGGRESG